ncbi:MAG: hypothetical protein KF778_02520 [Rhodocyclaceae bacterium]|nr:hypothetical protein [Rhodocyclaceae bacterium]MBX3667250.1 hypothetical protein [Rhodocyclaceae bacterium]
MAALDAINAIDAARNQKARDQFGNAFLPPAVSVDMRTPPFDFQDMPRARHVGRALSSAIPGPAGAGKAGVTQG